MGDPEMPGGPDGGGEGRSPAGGSTTATDAPRRELPTPRLRWPPAPRKRLLPGGEVQVRAAVLDRSPTARQALGRYLSADELRRIARLRQTRDQQRFLVCHGLLRKLLSGYVDVPPAELTFRCGRHGKPALAGPAAESGIHFNLSRSGPLALFAFARDVEVGVDVEARRPLPDVEDVAARFFSKDEIRKLLRVAPKHRRAAFYNTWTRKEAFVKAVGEGLSHPLSDFVVTVEPGEPTRLLRLAGDRADPDRWTLVHLEPAPGFVGAVAVPRPHIRVRCWS